MKIATLLCILFTSLAFAADPDPTAVAKAQITERATAYAAAWEKHDAKAIAVFYTEEADLVISSGESFSGRGAIEQSMQQWFDGILKDTTFAETIEKVRLIRPDLALVDSDIQIKSPGNDDPAGHFHLVTLLSKHDGKWLSETTRAVKYQQ